MSATDPGRIFVKRGTNESLELFLSLTWRLTRSGSLSQTWAANWRAVAWSGRSPLGAATSEELTGTNRDHRRVVGAMTKVLIVDDHPMFREALRSATQRALNEAQIWEAGSIDGAFEILSKEKIEIILLDLSLPGTSDFSGLILLRTRLPQTPIIIVSGLEDPKIVHEAIRLGAAGYVPKSVNKTVLAEALSEVLSGSVYIPLGVAQSLPGLQAKAEARDVASRIAELTPTQIRVLQLIRRGHLNKQIAHELRVSETTVKAHVSEILHKLKVVSRTQAVIETSQLDFDMILGPRTEKPN
jgi:DNA-binding NarL/FixJ family response regulator